MTDRQRPRSAKIPEAAFAAVIRAYLQSPRFLADPPIGLAAETKRSYRQYLRLAELPETLGAISVNVIHPADVQLFLDQFADRPGAQICARASLKAVERWAMVRRLLPYPITMGTEVVESGSEGHIPWTDEQVELVERHAPPRIARIITLGANTGQRCSDLYRMCPNDLEEYQGRMGINVRQRKTGVKLWIPLTRPLERAMATWERRPGPFLVTESGSAWSSGHALGEVWGKERNRNPALAPCRKLVLHGLRSTACVRLWELGCPTTLISKMVGMSLPMVERYVRGGNQKVSAMAAVHFLDRAGRTENEQAAEITPSSAKSSR